MGKADEASGMRAELDAAFRACRIADTVLLTHSSARLKGFGLAVVGQETFPFARDVTFWRRATG